MPKTTLSFQKIYLSIKQSDKIRSAMIELEIKKTKDFDIIGTWTFKQNSIRIGGYDSQVSEIKINNEAFNKDIIEINIKKSVAMLKLTNPNITVLLNGKKTVGNAPIKAQDHIEAGNTLMVVKKFHYTDYPLGEAISDNMRKIIKSNHPANQVIEKLEQYMRS